MDFLPGNAQHIGARSSQQDSFGFGDPDDEAFLAHGGFIAVVCDGMGGMEHGDAASRTAVRAFLDAYERKSTRETIPQALERSTYEANERVVELARELGAADSIGTTLVAAVLHENAGHKEMYFVSVGDSGLFYISDGQIQTVNRPHVFANILDSAVMRGALSKEQALLHPERESLTSFIGVGVLEEIDRNVDPWPIHDGDSILLASDGLFKTLRQEEILESLNGNPQAWADALIARTLDKKYEFQDNVTVLSVTVGRRDTLKLPPPAESVTKKGESTAELPPLKAKRSRKKLVAAVILGAIGLAIAGGGGWWYKKHHAIHASEKK